MIFYDPVFLILGYRNAIWAENKICISMHFDQRIAVSQLFQSPHQLQREKAARLKSLQEPVIYIVLVNFTRTSQLAHWCNLHVWKDAVTNGPQSGPCLWSQWEPQTTRLTSNGPRFPCSCHICMESVGHINPDLPIHLSVSPLPTGQDRYLDI